MFKILIIETVPKAVNPIDAHVRNALVIQTELKKFTFNIDILYVNENSKRFQKKYDLVLVSYATQFPLIHELEKIEEINKDSIWGWLTNEYNLAPNGQFFKIFKKTSSFMLSNYELGAVKFSCFKRYYAVNLNTLLFDEKPVTLKTHDFIYYGTYRPNREQYFRKYLTNQVYLSTSTKNHKKFLHIGSKAKPIAKFGWKRPALLNFRYSLYIEDEFTHQHFNNLANRFYESLACHCVLLFDKNCANTLKQAQLVDYEQFLINGAEDLQQYNASNYQERLNIQKQWKNNVLFERNNTIRHISDIFTNEIKQLSDLEKVVNYPD